jgi:hypothetical protein
MLVVVCASIPASQLLLLALRRLEPGRQQQQPQQQDQPTQPQQQDQQQLDALLVFQPVLALVLGVLFCTARAAASGAAWLTVGAALAGLLASSAPPVHGGVRGLAAAWCRRSRQLPRPALEWAFTGFLLLVSVGFVAGPVLAPWSGPVQPFVRWVPYR